jgi:hypothetical protein
VCVDVQTCRQKSIHDVEAVKANMVALAEDAQSLLGRVNRWILEGDGGPNRDKDQPPTLGSKDTMNLSHGTTIVGNVLEHMTADDNVERLRGKGEIGDIELKLDIGADDVGGVIAGAESLSQKRLEASLGSEVEDPLRATVEEVRLLRQKQPDEPVSLQ